MVKITNSFHKLYQMCKLRFVFDNRSTSGYTRTSEWYNICWRQNYKQAYSHSIPELIFLISNLTTYLLNAPIEPILWYNIRTYNILFKFRQYIWFINFILLDAPTTTTLNHLKFFKYICGVEAAIILYFNTVTLILFRNASPLER